MTSTVAQEYDIFRNNPVFMDAILGIFIPVTEVRESIYTIVAAYSSSLVF